MTDTPGWAPPGAPEPPREDRPTDGPSAPGSGPGPSAPQDALPGPGTPPPPGMPGPAAAPGWQPAPGWGTPQPGWGAPQPGWGAPQSGWGAPQPGWGTSGWGPPPAPKPGVIPLRPLGAGEILDGAVSTARRYWRTALGISLVVAMLSSATTLSIDWGSTNGTLSRTGASVSNLFNYGVLFLAGQLATALLTMVVSRAVLGRSVSLREAWTDTRPRLLSLLGLVLLMALIAAVIVGVLLGPGILAAVNDAEPAVTGLGLGLGGLAAVACTLWLGIRFSLAAPALMLEKQGIKASLSRSARLVSGSWWRIFGITLLGSLVTGIVSLVIMLPATIVGMAIDGGTFLDPASTASPSLLTLVCIGIGTTVASMLTLPVTAGINVLLYVDQRIRREALDIELARAAGLPGFGDTTASPGA
ncbi:glycerophosphoryl diester phosphodiesterase membrane domain-containing protein [Peterkaempfera bronchialis]|uniref:DUF7847 domain-containing protein n=1 Tax=Peterkaempfera bronchialis TaxID=2126346 RepID=A0A345SVP5_9ACTN|nr:glycerophosphoryl diester phosphodiesterase membrane domain-containing protein [Peterkaempfera bronchialis]AXI77800.1 hypothetical protein C7M71_010490 [Peterkaempfera bronchialis]